MFRVIASIIVITCIALVSYLSSQPTDHGGNKTTSLASPPRIFKF